MTTHTSRLVVFASLCVLAGALAGCASVAVTDEAIEKNTAFALGIERGSFTISNRENDGVKTTYLVTTKSGKKHNCYVTGTIGVTGRTVSDALCSPVGQAAGNRSNSSNVSCNALLKAAGRC